VDFFSLSERLERIYTPRLALRPVCVSDAFPLFNATRNELFNKHLLWNRPDDRRQVVDRVDAIIDAARRGRIAAVSAVVRDTGEWVSLFRFIPYARQAGAVEMGIWTHHNFWHGRYSLELGRACVDAAFRFSDTEFLVGAAAVENKSSCTLMRVCGLEPYETVKRPTEDGGTVELLEHRISREAWEDAARSEPFGYLERAHAPIPAISNSRIQLNAGAISVIRTSVDESQIADEDLQEDSLTSVEKWPELPRWNKATHSIPRIHENTAN
jgi:RimJ/RimL family protein N-acetyltransferase